MSVLELNVHCRHSTFIVERLQQGIPELVSQYLHQRIFYFSWAAPPLPGRSICSMVVRSAERVYLWLDKWFTPKKFFGGQFVD